MYELNARVYTIIRGEGSHKLSKATMDSQVTDQVCEAQDHRLREFTRRVSARSVATRWCSRVPSHSHRTRSRASVYILTLGSTTAVVVIGLATITLLRIERRNIQQTADSAEARLYAQSAIDLGLRIINTDMTWRLTRLQGPWTVSAPIGRGTYSLDAVDALDGDFSNNSEDHVLLTGTGIVPGSETTGDAQYSLQAELQPTVPPGMDSLASAIHTRNVFIANSTVNVDALISSNAIVNITTSGVVNGDVEAVNTITVSGVLTGNATEGASVKEMPASNVLDYYIGVGTPIDITSIPGGLVEDVVFSPSSNPYGLTTNPNGIYVINCQSLDIIIQNCRIVGTLLLIDTGPASKIASSVHWEPALPNYPALMVRGNFTFDALQTPLKEPLRGVSFNPPGTPYVGGADDDTNDVYPQLLKGLIYISGDLTVLNSISTEGHIICMGAQMDVRAPLTVTHDPTLIDAPPPGFERSFRPMEVIAGSWKQIVN